LERKQIEELLSSKRIIVLDGDITRDVADKLAGQMLYLSAKSTDKITFLIDSSGGDINAAFVVYDTMQTFGLNVHGIVIGTCQSAANIILLGCKWREATPHSRFLVHNVYSETRIIIDEDDETMRERTGVACASGQSARKKKMEVYAKHTKQADEVLARLITRGQKYGEMLNAEDALKYGFIQRIVESYPLFGPARSEGEPATQA
jgi:ATP-dependent Clp protease, protease subunit